MKQTEYVTDLLARLETMQKEIRSSKSVEAKMQPSERATIHTRLGDIIEFIQNHIRVTNK